MPTLVFSYSSAEPQKIQSFAHDIKTFHGLVQPSFQWCDGQTTVNDGLISLGWAAPKQATEMKHNPIL